MPAEERWQCCRQRACFGATGEERKDRAALRRDADGAGQDGAPDTRVVLPVGQRDDGGGDGGAPLLLPEENNELVAASPVCFGVCNGRCSKTLRAFHGRPSEATRTARTTSGRTARPTRASCFRSDSVLPLLIKLQHCVCSLCVPVFVSAPKFFLGAGAVRPACRRLSSRRGTTRSGSGARCSGTRRWWWRSWSQAARPRSRRSCRRLSTSARWGNTRSCSAGTPRVGLRGERRGSGARYGCSGWEGGRAGRSAPRRALAPTAGVRHRGGAVERSGARFSFLDFNILDSSRLHSQIFQ